MTDNPLVEAMKVAALTSLAYHGPLSDVQELLVRGDGRGVTGPGAIDKMMNAALRAIEDAGWKVVKKEEG